MFLSAVKIAVAILACELQADRLSDHEKAIWNQVRPGVVTLSVNGKPSGVAALIDDSGYFVAHTSSVEGTSAVGKTAAGRVLNFNVLSKDSATQLALLKTDGWQEGIARPFHSPANRENDLRTIIAVLPSGPIRAAYGSQHRMGVLNPSRRLVSLAEIRFEASSQMVGGALIFSDNYEFVGTLNATLERADNPLHDNAFSQQGGGQGVSQSLDGRTRVNDSNTNQNSGPAEMTVAYAVGLDVVHHTLDGFLSKDHLVEYAYLGIFCVDAVQTGALIQKVTPNSPADKAGLRPGDVLLNIGFSPVTDQVAFANLMLQQKVGQKMTLLIKRGRASLLVDVVAGKATN